VPNAKPPGRPLFTARQLQTRVKSLAGDIAKAYHGKSMIAVGLMNGSLFFLVDILRHLPWDYHVECWRVQSYKGTQSTGKIMGLDQVTGDFKGRHVLVIDDILDTGTTLHAVVEHLKNKGAARVDVCVLLRKHKKRVKKVTAKWVGFDIADEFVIGYGLDVDGQYRGLPDIRVLN
jgi:hypoxanthine phosphoribosyltransferase